MIVILVASLVVLVIVALGLGALRNRSIRKKIERGELDKFPDIQQIEDMDPGGVCKALEQLCDMIHRILLGYAHTGHLLW